MIYIAYELFDPNVYRADPFWCTHVLLRPPVWLSRDISVDLTVYPAQELCASIPGCDVNKIGTVLDIPTPPGPQGVSAPPGQATGAGAARPSGMTDGPEFTDIFQLST